MIPLYGFLAGDTIGVLVYAKASDTVAEIARKLERNARLRAGSIRRVRVLCRGRDVPLTATVKESGIRPLERFEVDGFFEDDQPYPLEGDAPFDRYDLPEEADEPFELR